MTKAPIRAFALASVGVLVSFSHAEPVHPDAPVAVSPGGPIGDAASATSAERCPTFSWGGLDGATAYELAVYRIDERGRIEPELVLWQRIVGSALGWTPALERCPRGGGRYAWSVRAVTPEGFSGWSASLSFATSEQPSDQELASALEVVRRHLAARQAAGTPPAEGPSPTAGGVDQVGGDAGTAGASTGAGGSGSRGITRLASPVVAAGNPTASVTVAGEVRTIDPADPAGPARLWGRGRVDAEVYGIEFLGTEGWCTTDSLRYGLSTVAVDWGSAADACPAGSWVCRRGEIEDCDTNRPSTHLLDGIACDGTHQSFPEAEHLGWVADKSNEEVSGMVMFETGATSGRRTCETLPVWCCWG